MATIDNSIFQFIHSLAGKSAILDLIAVFFASYIAYILIFLWIFFFFKERGFKARFYFFALTALSAILSRGIITEVIRFFYWRSRPFIVLNFEPMISHVNSFSFPSGHMTFYFVLFMSVFYITKSRQLKWWFFSLVVLMGLARIAAGVHWPSDIIGGIIIAALSAFLIRKLLPKPEFVIPA